jgi:hypothetical protein
MVRGSPENQTTSNESHLIHLTEGFPDRLLDDGVELHEAQSEALGELMIPTRSISLGGVCVTR